MKKSFFVVEVEPDLHKAIKIQAVERGITMRKWILRAIIEKIKAEKDYE